MFLLSKINLINDNYHRKRLCTEILIKMNILITINLKYKLYSKYKIYNFICKKKEYKLYSILYNKNKGI